MSYSPPQLRVKRETIHSQLFGVQERQGDFHHDLLEFALRVLDSSSLYIKKLLLLARLLLLAIMLLEATYQEEMTVSVSNSSVMITTEVLSSCAKIRLPRLKFMKWKSIKTPMLIPSNRYTSITRKQKAKLFPEKPYSSMMYLPMQDKPKKVVMMAQVHRSLRSVCVTQPSCRAIFSLLTAPLVSMNSQMTSSTITIAQPKKQQPITSYTEQPSFKKAYPQFPCLWAKTITVVVRMTKVSAMMTTSTPLVLRSFFFVASEISEQPFAFRIRIASSSVIQS